IISYVVLLGGLVLGILAVSRSRPELVLDAYSKARERLVLGLPLGSVLLIALNLGFYLVAQRGFYHPSTPLDMPFYSWSYTNLVGIFTSPIAHAGPSHLIGNTTAALVFLPAAEYIVGHKTGRRPLARIVGFAAVGYGVGVFVTVFSWGPTVGFSGALLAFVGFVVVTHPVRGVALLVLNEIVGVLLSALRSPVVVSSGG
ncbi:MAG: rhomboid family intramembrane serine protease, partial [Halobacteria archaeon]|nr:rhomboid family intramembrane serine protease [Halobacteria archaeon]